jgi:hypothetical protein
MREGCAPQAREPPHLWLHLQKVKRSKVEPRNLAEATGSAILLTRIVFGILLETQRTEGRYLGHVFAGLRPVEVGRVAGQNDDAAGRICFDLVAVEPITEADVENAGHDRVVAVLRVSVGHQLHAGGRLDPIT